MPRGIERRQVKALLCRIKCNEIGYTLIERTNMKCEWYQDTDILNIQE